MRSRFLAAAGLAVAMIAAGPVRADDAAAKTNAEGDPIVEVLGNVVEGIGGVLKVLVGPPISSPTPYLGLEGAAMPAPPAPEPPAPQPAAAAPQAAPPPIVITVPAPPMIVPVAVMPTPLPIQPPPKAAASPAVKPAPRPAPPPAPVAAPAPQPVCARRVAATATLEQAARLPRCP